MEISKVSSWWHKFSYVNDFILFIAKHDTVTRFRFLIHILDAAYIAATRHNNA
jgi:hypothetical protein